MKKKVVAPVTFVAGAVAGAATGVLLAPDKGSKTRSNLKKGIHDSAETLDDAKTRAKITAKHTKQEAKENIKAIKSDAKEKIDNLSE